MKQCKISIHYSAMLVLALALLLVPLQWVVGWGVAVTVHELSHYLALKAMGVPITEIKIGAFGAKICAAPVTNTEEFVGAAAGPAGGLLLAVIAAWVPGFRFCALVQSLFNLLPIYPLDGGRMFRIVSVRLLGEKAGDFICNVMNILLPVALLGVIIWFYITKCMLN